LINLFDYGWLLLHTSLLVSIGLREFLKPYGRNIYMFALTVAMLVLVNGQAWWVFSQFSDSQTSIIYHINKTISADGAKLANFYLGLSIIVLCVTYRVMEKKAFKNEFNSTPLLKGEKSVNAISNSILVLWALFFSYIAFDIMGGVSEVITHPGQFMGNGATVFLVLVHVARLQFLKSIAKNQQPQMVERLLFVFVIIFQLFNGRGWMLFFVFQLLIVYNYSKKEITRKTSVLFFLLFLFVIFIFGMYRHFTSLADPVTLNEYISYYFFSDNPINWFYSTSLESFTGLAGILTYKDTHLIVHDFGISNLTFWMKLIPYQVRLDPTFPFVQLNQFILSMYPYPDSITKSGYESFYAHFGVFGILSLGFLFSYCANKFHLGMISNNSNKFKIAIYSSYLLLLLYGNLFFIFFYATTETIGLIIFWILNLISKQISIGILKNKSRKFINISD